jgi:hypothetical protein
VAWLTRRGLFSSERIRQALLKVPREDFIPREYRDYTCLEVPLPLPGEQATISCQHSTRSSWPKLSCSGASSAAWRSTVSSPSSTPHHPGRGNRRTELNSTEHLTAAGGWF